MDGWMDGWIDGWMDGWDGWGYRCGGDTNLGLGSRCGAGCELWEPPKEPNPASPVTNFTLAGSLQTLVGGTCGDITLYCGSCVRSHGFQSVNRELGVAPCTTVLASARRVSKELTPNSVPQHCGVVGCVARMRWMSQYYGFWVRGPGFP